MDCGLVRVFFSLMEGSTIDYNTLVTLPIEVLVHIVSFLPTRDKRCISKTLRSIRLGIFHGTERNVFAELFRYKIRNGTLKIIYL